MALKILLADDSMTAQNMGKKILVDAGYEVIAVSNGAAAVKKIAEHKPALIILDIYMPGYTGLEVCERVKAAQETSKTPVLLTVGKMEMGTFKPEDGDRVKADGLIIKPFEATDLLAAVQKIEQKLAEPAPEPEYEKTMKIAVPAEFRDASYEEWKVSADEHDDEGDNRSAQTAVPVEMAGAPAFGDMLGEETPAEDISMRATMPIEPKKIMQEAAAAGDAAAQDATMNVGAPEPAPELAAADTQPIELPAEANTAPVLAPMGHKDPEVEFTSARSGHPVEHVHDPAFEPTVSQEHITVEHAGVDPALVTDPTEMAGAFVTKFGVENPDEVTVGVAAEMPGLYADSAPPPAAVDGEVTIVEEEEETEDTAATSAAPEDDFESRVAAAMTAYETPAAETAPSAVADAPVAATAPEAIAPAEPAPAPAVADAVVARSGWSAQEAPVESHEASGSLDEEMMKAFAASAGEGEAPAAEAVTPTPAPPAPAVENAPDLALAAAMAAAVGAGTEPAAAASASTTGATDASKLADAIHRAFERLKPNFISEITKELEKK